MLDQTQIDRFHRQGYLVVEDVLDGDSRAVSDRAPAETEV